MKLDDLLKERREEILRIPGNDVLYDHIRHLLTRPVGRPPKKPIVWHHSFSYQAGAGREPVGP